MPKFQTMPFIRGLKDLTGSKVDLNLQNPGISSPERKSNTVTRDYFKHNPTIWLKIYLILFIKYELSIVLNNESKYLKKAMSLKKFGLDKITVMLLN